MPGEPGLAGTGAGAGARRAWAFGYGCGCGCGCQELLGFHSGSRREERITVDSINKMPLIFCAYNYKEFLHSTVPKP